MKFAASSSSPADGRGTSTPSAPNICESWTSSSPRGGAEGLAAEDDAAACCLAGGGLSTLI
eukprot:1375140-Pyramimonas_sp.AAC.1